MVLPDTFLDSLYQKSVTCNFFVTTAESCAVPFALTL